MKKHYSTLLFVLGLSTGINSVGLIQDLLGIHPIIHGSIFFLSIFAFLRFKGFFDGLISSSNASDCNCKSSDGRKLYTDDPSDDSRDHSFLNIN